MLDAAIPVYTVDAVRSYVGVQFLADAGVSVIHSHIACIEMLLVDEVCHSVPYVVTLLPLPPKYPAPPRGQPGVNPVENVWQFRRNKRLSNPIVTPYDDIVDHCCNAWNTFVEQPRRITSIGLRQWANG